jgi:tetratricopeptide (TPR) repeat protein
MNRDNLLFAIIGILIGFIIGFMLANSILTREAAMRAAPLSATQQSGNLPPNHPPVNGADQSGDPQQMFTQVQEAMKQAREHPDDFEAQLTAAKLEYQIQRFDQAVEYLLIANKLKPNDFNVLGMLGEANMDGGHLDAAEKWYRAALQKKPDEVAFQDGFCNVLLVKGDAKAAEECINKLAKLDSSVDDLPQFRERLAKLKSGSKPKQ